MDTRETNLVDITCPSCGAPLERKENEYFAKCPYCGTETGFDELMAEAQLGRLKQRVNAYEDIDRDREVLQKKQKSWSLIKNIFLAIFSVCNLIGFGIVGTTALQRNDHAMMFGVMFVLMSWAGFFFGVPILSFCYPDRDILTGKKEPGKRVGVFIRLSILSIALILVTAFLAFLIVEPYSKQYR